jgi:transcription initiation factor IIE alpha subunit
VTKHPPEDDIALFQLFAGQETRAVLEALIERPMRQKELCVQLGVSQQVLGPVIRRLTSASLVVRDSPRGKLRLSRFDEIAGLLELEAKLSSTIQKDREKRAEARRRRIQKRRMSGKAAQEDRRSA